MFSAFTAVFEALEAIEHELATGTSNEQREKAVETLLSLRKTMDKCVQYWLKFEEKVNRIQERFSIVLPDTLPAGFLEDFTKFDENGKEALISPLVEETPKKEEENPFASLENEKAITSFRRGLGFWELAMVSEAVQEFRKVLQEQPNLLIGHFCLGLASAQLGLHDEAFKELKLVLALDQNNSMQALALNTLGTILAGREQYQQALTYFARATEKDPELPEAWFNQAAVYYNLQQYREAAEAFEKVRDMVPDDWEIELYLGKARGYLGENEKAAQALERAYRLNPREPLITFELGLLYRLMGKRSQAQCYFHATRRLLEVKA